MIEYPSNTRGIKRIIESKVPISYNIGFTTDITPNLSIPEIAWPDSKCMLMAINTRRQLCITLALTSDLQFGSTRTTLFTLSTFQQQRLRNNRTFTTPTKFVQFHAATKESFMLLDSHSHNIVLPSNATSAGGILFHCDLIKIVHEDSEASMFALYETKSGNDENKSGNDDILAANDTDIIQILMKYAILQGNNVPNTLIAGRISVNRMVERLAKRKSMFKI